MTWYVPILPLVCISAVFNVQTIPLSAPSAYVFLGCSATETTADVYALDGYTLTAYSAREATALSVTLAEGTSAFDIGALDPNRPTVVVGICGDEVLRYAFPREGKPESPVVLFRQHNLLGERAVSPYPYVLILKRDNQTVLALPCEDGLELHALDGNLIANYPIGPNTAQRVSYGVPFSASPVSHPQVGTKDSIEVVVHRDIELEPELPADIPSRNPLESAVAESRSRIVREDEDQWMWFPLKTDGGMSRRVFVRRAPSRHGTLVQVRETKSETATLDAQEDSKGLQRTYPGLLVVPNWTDAIRSQEIDLPDFNRDGYTDLALFRAPEPSMSVDGITRALVGQTWPIEIAVHLFSPEKGRYEPVSASHITCSVPITWLLSASLGAPVRHCVLRDFDGDGRTDFGCSTAPNTYAVWLYGERGFGSEPDFSMTFPEPITSVAFRESLDVTGRTSIGLRTEKAVYVLRPM